MAGIQQQMAGASGADSATATAFRGRTLRDAAGHLTPTAWIALVVVCLAVFLTALDQTVVVTVLTNMMADTNVPITQPDRAAWIVSGYLLGYVIAMPLMGRAGDVFGRFRVFALCLGIFALGSVVCAVSPQLGAPIAPDFTTLGGAILTPFYNAVQALAGPLAHIGIDTTSPGLDVLVAARFVQAVGGGALVPVGMAVVADLFGAGRRGLALGIVGAVTEAGGVLGPVYGAAITRAWGWTWIFYLNVPISLALLVAGFLTLPRSRGARERLDVPGALLFGTSIACLTIGLGQQNGQIGTAGANASGAISMNPRFLIAAAVLFALFLGVELLLRAPVVDPRLFRRRALSAASALSLITGIALIVALVEIPLYMDTQLNYDAVGAGLALLRLTAFIPVGAILGGALAARFGCPLPAALGVVCTALGLWLMHLWPANVGQGQITLATVICGLGFGLVIAPVSTSALNGSPRSQAGVASSAITVLRMTGMTVGLAGLTAWGITRFNALYTQLAARYGATTGGTLALHQVLTDLFAAAALIALVGIVPALLLWRRGEGQAGEETGAETAPASSIGRYVAPLG
ncbi:MAG TPA: MFS transporter [Ktedonobacterales bacterium]